MKITDIRTLRLRASIPPRRQVRSRTGIKSHRSAILVQVHTDAGITGIGSCSGNGAIIEVVVEKVLKPLLIGRNPFQLEELWETSYFGAGVREFGSRGIGVVALSGVDIALWDIVGKARNIPVFELLGGACRERVEVYATALYPEEPAGVVEKAVGFAEKGFRGVNGHGAALYV